jgi:uncharacterized protein YndB with AHSA1/START domain
MTDLSLHLQKTLNAPIEKVFDAWLEADTLSKFMTPMPGMPEPRVEAEGKEGGSFTIFMVVEGQEIPHKGQYLEVKRYDKLVYTWESPFSSDGSVVTILFSATADGGTAIDFSHVKFPDEESRDNHEGGWTLILEALDTILKTAVTA